MLHFYYDNRIFTKIDAQRVRWKIRSKLNFSDPEFQGINTYGHAFLGFKAAVAFNM